jgi:GABA(A) receptor-associated protein
MMATFKEQNSFAQRQIEALRIRDKFPSRIPVIVERSPQSRQIPNLDKTKFLVPGDLTVGQFIFIIRRRISLPPETALFLFVNGTLPTTSTLMKELYTSLADNDGFLYTLYSGENVFGGGCSLRSPPPNPLC